MRKLLAIFLILACASIASARNLGLVGGGVPVSGGCSTVERTATTNNNDVSVGDGSIIMAGGSFKVGASNACVCAITLALARTATVPDGSLSLELWSSSSNAPVEQIGADADGGGPAGNGTATGATLTTSAAEYTFTWSSCVDLTANAIVFPMLVATDTSGNSGTKKYKLYFNSSGDANACGTGLACRMYSYVSSWSATDSSADIYGIIYK